MVAGLRRNGPREREAGEPMSEQALFGEFYFAFE
jgi:hypothetical protein